ncbi:arylesterase [Gemmatimonadetes bacterium T265]|nr:arylesterase [Gemmatimonadetes bacterium T265]
MPYLKTTAAPTTDLYFEDSGGSGQAVVLIHGWPLSLRSWESQANALTAAGYRVVAYDRRGFGESGKATGGYDYDTFASDLNDLLTELNLSNAVLVGFSMGGGEVARYIGRYGEGRVAKAVLMSAVTPYLLKTADNPDGGLGESDVEQMVAGVTKDRINFLHDFLQNFYKGGLLAPKASDDVINFAKSLAWRASPLGTQRCIVAFGTTDFRGDLAKFTVPTLVLHGDSDGIVPIDASGRRAAELVKGSRLEVVSGGPHGITATHADKVNTVLLDFLRS